MDIGTDPNPATTGLLADEHIYSFLLRIRRRAGDILRWPVWFWMLPLPIRALVWLRTRLLVSPSLWSPLAPPPTWMSALPIVYFLTTDVADFDPTSAWGDGFEVTTAIPDGADFDPTSPGSVWGGGDGATTAIPTSVWGDGDEATAAILEAVPTRKRKHMANV